MRILGSSWIGKSIHILRTAVVAVLEKTVPATQVAGFSVLDLLRDEKAFARRQQTLAQAIETIRIHDPRLFRRVAREIRRVIFLESGPEFWPRARACVLGDIDRQSVISTACQVVHEATHARLWRLGFRYGEEIRERIEMICVAAELDLLEKVPGGEALLDETAAKLRNPWWTQSVIRQRRADDLHSLGSRPSEK